MERGLKGMLCEEQLKEAAILNLEKGKINKQDEGTNIYVYISNTIHS